MRTKRTTRWRENTASNLASDCCPILAPAQFIHNRLFQRITLRSTTNLWVLPSGWRVIMRVRCVVRWRGAEGKNYGCRLSSGRRSPRTRPRFPIWTGYNPFLSLFVSLLFHSAPFIARWRLDKSQPPSGIRYRTSRIIQRRHFWLSRRN